MPVTYMTGAEHAAACNGDPVIEESGHEWTATCMHAYDAARCPWEVTGCESRAEAGAAFFGCDPRHHPGDHFYVNED